MKEITRVRDNICYISLPMSWNKKRCLPYLRRITTKCVDRTTSGMATSSSMVVERKNNAQMSAIVSQGNQGGK